MCVSLRAETVTTNSLSTSTPWMALTHPIQPKVRTYMCMGTVGTYRYCVYTYVGTVGIGTVYICRYCVYI